jgi:hypothetical protein
MWHEVEGSEVGGGAIQTVQREGEVIEGFKEREGGVARKGGY